MNITLYPDRAEIYRDDDGGRHLSATESQTNLTIDIVLTPELEKELMPLQEAEKKKIAEEAFEKGVEEGRSCQAILELQGRDKFLASLKD